MPTIHRDYTIILDDFGLTSSPRKKRKARVKIEDDKNLGFRRFIRKIEGKDLTVENNSG